LYELSPIRKLLYEQVNLDHIASWAAAGGWLRMSTVALESGQLRYVTEAGRVIERDGTSVMWGGPLTAACAHLKAGVEAAEREILVRQPQSVISLGVS
jgi:hypothetical protein